MTCGSGPAGPVLVAILLLLAAGARPERPGAEARPDVMLMTGLPLVWGEGGAFDPSSRPAAAYSDLSRDFDFRPVDLLDEATLGRGRALFLVQPHRLAPAELAAIDRWIRNGGRALILTDPTLAWPSALPLGDIRRPPPAGLLAPLLGHWGLAMDPPPAPGESSLRWNGLLVAMDSPGRLRSSGPACVVGSEGRTALCRLGRGRARVVADADLVRDSLWTRGTSDNREAVEAWLGELTGTPRPRAGFRPVAAAWAALACALVAAGIAIRLLLRRRRKR
ncbi:MAG TPA: Gldg family protein [Allosphingosinicella sp.]|jgi:hypothetical protein